MTYSSKDHRLKTLEIQLSELNEEEREYFLTVIAELDEESHSQTYKDLLKPDWKWEPPSWREFITSDYFAGKRGRTLFPMVRDELEEIFAANVSEVILTGSIGWGKSYAASFGMAYDLVWLLCMRNAQEYCGVASGTAIVMMNLSVTRAQAAGGLYKYVSDIVSDMPFFLENFPEYDFKLNGPEFPNEDVFFKQGGSTEFGAIGQNVIGGALDEANFMIGVRKSKRARMAGELDQANVLYDQIARRRKSRFVSAGGRLPSRFWLISSVQFPGDFLEERIRISRSNPDVRVLDHNQWETWKSDPRHKNRFSGKNFALFVGNTTARSHIIAEDANEIKEKTIDVPPGCHLIEVPVEFREEFREDLYGAIKDIAGKPILAVNPLFENIDLIDECICLEDLGDVERVHPFEFIESNVIHPDICDFRKYPVTFERERGSNGKEPEIIIRPAIHPGVRRFAHVDLSETGDATGVCVGHYGGHKDIEVFANIPDENGDMHLELFKEVRPTIVIDFMMKFVPPVGGRIDIDAVRMIILSFAEVCGWKYELITYDQFQSATSIAAFNQMGIESKKFSVDRNDDPYILLRSAISDKRFSCYEYSPFKADCATLQHDIAKRKVDHTPGGSKDVSDCAAAVVSHVEEFHPRQIVPLGPVKGLLHDHTDIMRKQAQQFKAMVAGLDPEKLREQELARKIADEFDPFDAAEGRGTYFGEDGDSDPWKDM